MCQNPCALWRQGGINILVNTATTGFAHTSFVAHGTTVSELALRVPDAQAAADRARALLVAGLDQPTPAGELEIPAIRGAGGSLIRFVDDHRLWEVDFRTTPAPEGAGLLRVDHVAQTMPYDEMLSGRCSIPRCSPANARPWWTWPTWWSRGGSNP
jgi:4-hydroxyphenylpyruvate dioxygenase